MRSATAGLLALALGAGTAHADGYLLFADDRAAFESALFLDAWSTVVDTDGAFAPDPAAGTGLGSVTRSGLVGGEAFTYRLFDANFSTTASMSSGSITPGAAGGDIVSTSPIDVERPATQNGAVGTGSWGVDGGSGSTTSRNALLVDFTTTPGGLGLGHLGLDLLDFDASAGGVRGQLRLYRAGTLVFARDFDWGADSGKGRMHFLGVVRVPGEGESFDQAMFVLGGASASTANAASYAADRLTFGRAVANPEPATLALFALGAAGLAGMALRTRRAARRST